MHVAIFVSIAVMVLGVDAHDFLTAATDTHQIGTFIEMMNTSGMVDEITSGGPYTIFAPNDDAFNNVSLPTNMTELENLLRYHIVKGKILQDGLNETLEATDGNSIVVEPIQIDSERVIAINDASVVDGDFEFDGGVIHIISKVLNPAYQEQQVANDPEDPADTDRNAEGDDDSNSPPSNSGDQDSQDDNRPRHPLADPPIDGAPQESEVQPQESETQPEQDFPVSNMRPLGMGRPGQPYMGGHQPTMMFPGATGGYPGHRPYFGRRPSSDSVDQDFQDDDRPRNPLAGSSLGGAPQESELRPDQDFPVNHMRPRGMGNNYMDGNQPTMMFPGATGAYPGHRPNFGRRHFPRYRRDPWI